MYIFGGVHIKPVDGFNLLVTVQGHKDSYTGEELIGIEEIELALSSYEPVLYIKESQYPNVILVELTMDPEEAVAILKEAPTTVISKVVPIDAVVKTQIDSILEKAWVIAREKMNPGDKFVVRADLRGRSHIKSKEELIEVVSNELIDKLDETLDPLSLNTPNPDWVVQIEVVGEDTGISVLKPHQLLKKK
jgi:tRNA acetyltransferase TAN1